MSRPKRRQSPAQLANLERGRKPAPPAPHGHRRSVVHGGYARIAGERLHARERQIFEALAEDAPLRPGDVLPAADTARVRVLAQAMCRLDDVSAWINAHGGPLDRRGRPRPAADLERRLRREVGEHLDAMGMSPLARARLGVDVARVAEIAQRLEAPPDARERSARAAALLVDVGALELDAGSRAPGGNGGAGAGHGTSAPPAELDPELLAARERAEAAELESAQLRARIRRAMREMDNGPEEVA